MRKSKLRNAGSKRGRPPTGHKLAGTDKLFHREYPGQEPRIIEHQGPSITQSLDYNDQGNLNNVSSDHKYPPPKQHPIFQKIWLEHIDNITARENFKIGHLQTLAVLCDLHIEYSELTQFIQENGRSYKSIGRSGLVLRPYPEVAMLRGVQAQIREYMKVMGLVLKKDNTTELDGNDDDWT